MTDMNQDPFDSGTPKYSTAQDIYDALQELVQTEEMSLLSEIGVDVSWEQQGYYYTDKGQELVEKFERLSDYGNKMWLLDLAIFQMDKGEISDIIYQALCDEDVAKRTSFKKLFIDEILSGYTQKYVPVSEAWMYGLQELDRFDFRSMCSTLTQAMTDAGYRVVENPYINFCGHYYDKVMGLRLEAEKQLIAECRAHLTAYDDFLYGLRVNQALHEEQERSYQQRVTQLKASYEAAVNQLLSIAEKRGLATELMGDLKMIGGAP